MGRTESVKNTANPEWQTSFNLTYHFHQKQVQALSVLAPQTYCNSQGLRFSIFDIDNDSSNLNDHDNLGSAECSLAQILAVTNNEVIL